MYNRIAFCCFVSEVENVKRQSILVLAMVVLFVLTPWTCKSASGGTIVAWGRNTKGQCNIPKGDVLLPLQGASYPSV